MPRADKVAVVDEVRQRLTDSAATVLTEYRGLTVSELAQLRARLRAAGGEYKVVKNTLTAIAAKDAGYSVPDDLLTGPTAITFVREDPVAIAKVLRQFSREHPHLVVKGGILEGRVIDAAETMRLADLASREEMLAQTAGLISAAVAQPARLAKAALSKAARLFAALQDKLPAGEAAPAESAAEAPAAEAPAAEAESAAEAPAAEAPAEAESAAEAPAETPAEES
jgi:large subunit ribosomal protein L10